ncbi:MAG TPA: NAD-dependent epimerase/dehydratase family protein [Pyrinomonadaceae bacterium]|nr:NAD-dependent epimerase/dehydratase family protein [Pyrinomonadaceae bacterium]
MRIAITGASGFVGTHLTQRLEFEGHELVLISRRQRIDDARAAATDLADVSVLRELFRGCKVVAHCAGINRDTGNQTYRRVHVEGTRNVVEAAKAAGVEKIVLTSFLRARANCGSPYHESKWEAEEIVRNSGLDYTIVKAGVVYGLGDHMLDHLSHALHTFPIFALVGLKEKSIRPLAVEDLVHVMRGAMIDRRMKRQTIAVTGPEEIYLSEAVRRVAEVVGKRPLMFPLPVVCHKLMAHIFELTMKVPLTSLAQVRILSEGFVDAGTPVSPLPYDLVPTRRFTAEQIRPALVFLATKKINHKKAHKAQRETMDQA